MFCFYSRAKEWLAVCKRPDLVRRVDSNDININNYYVCEVHFPNQILDYSTRKILIKTAKPLSMAELNALPPSSHLPMRKAYIADLDEEYDEDTNDGKTGGNAQKATNIRKCLN